MGFKWSVGFKLTSSGAPTSKNCASVKESFSPREKRIVGKIVRKIKKNRTERVKIKKGLTNRKARGIIKIQKAYR